MNRINHVRQAGSFTEHRKRAPVFDKCRRFTRAAELRTADLYPYFRPLTSPQGPDVVCEGRRMIMMSSNNYLGLASHPRVKEAAIDAVCRYGTGCAGSRFLNGTLAIHEELEQRLASFLRKEAALVFPTGFQANLGAISALVAKNEFIVIDKLNHASIVDGCRLSFAQVGRFRHDDLDDLERVLQDAAGRGALVVVDGVFSMEGDIAELPGIVELCRRFGAGLMVDDAHGLGVLGVSGRGTAEYFELEADVDVVVGTFSKSLATIGGYIAAAADVIDYLKHHARSLIFSASLPAPDAAAALTALDITENEPDRRQRLWVNTRYLREGLEALGFDTGKTQTPIIPVFVGDEQKLLNLWRALFDRGILTSPVLAPAVPAHMALIRMSCMATHTIDHIETVLDAFEEAGKQMGLVP